MLTCSICNKTPYYTLLHLAAPVNKLCLIIAPLMMIEFQKNMLKHMIQFSTTLSSLKESLTPPFNMTIT